MGLKITLSRVLDLKFGDLLRFSMLGVIDNEFGYDTRSWKVKIQITIHFTIYNFCMLNVVEGIV